MSLEGSTPSPSAACTPGQSLLVATPGSEPGGERSIRSPGAFGLVTRLVSRPACRAGADGFNPHTRRSCVGWALASLPGCNPDAIAVQVQLLPDALTGPFVYWRRTPAPHAGKMGSIPIRAADMAKWWNGRHATLRTSCPPGMGVRLSPWSLFAGGRGPADPHKVGAPGSSPGPATLGRVRKPAKRSD